MNVSYLWDTAPYCGSGACYVHWTAMGDVEHHVSPCVAAETVAGHMHTFNHAVTDAKATIGRAIGPAVTRMGVELRVWYASLPLLTRIDIRLRLAWRRWRR